MSWLAGHPGELLALLGQHLALVGAALAAALALALPLGYWAAHRPALIQPIYGLFGAIYTIPSLALLALLVPVLGLGFWTAVVALAAYAQMILIRNTVEGFRGIAPAQIDAAAGLGMTRAQQLWRVELPLALPVLVGGVRIATVSLIAIASVAAWINAGGLGVLFFDGIHRNDVQKIVAGSVASAALAAIADTLLRGLERVVRT
ncbi:MAG: ABC transporter permease [Candidatus Eremiobacteraeota bacterium]|nr:ABC transporter permease [Candidatus Eremiobacteraeota bacterium]